MKRKAKNRAAVASIREQLDQGLCLELCSGDEIVYRFVYKQPGIVWLQKECFPFPNAIWTLICEYYKTSEWIDNFRICISTGNFKIMVQHLWQCTHLEVKSLATFDKILFGGSIFFGADASFPRTFATWISLKVLAVEPRFAWFQLPPFYHETWKKHAIEKKKRVVIDLKEKIARKMQSISKLQRECDDDAAFISWK